MDSLRHKWPSIRIEVPKICIDTRTSRPNKCVHPVRPVKKLQHRSCDCLWSKIRRTSPIPKMREANQNQPSQQNLTKNPKNKFVHVDLHSFVRKDDIHFWTSFCPIFVLLLFFFDLIIREIHRERWSSVHWKRHHFHSERERRKSDQSSHLNIYADRCDQQISGESTFPARCLISIQEKAQRGNSLWFHPYSNHVAQLRSARLA